MSWKFFAALTTRSLGAAVAVGLLVFVGGNALGAPGDPGTYSSGVYGAGVFSTGGAVAVAGGSTGGALPVTGVGAASLIAALAAAIVAGLLHWAKEHRRARLAQQP